MCQPASLILTETEEYFSLKTDNHHEIISEHNIRESTGERINILKVEITTENWLKPLEEWEYRIDQDILPQWYDEKKDEERARRALKKWAEAKLFTEGRHEVRDQQAYVAGTATVEAYGNSTVEASYNSTVIAHGNSTVKAYDNTTVKAYDNSTVIAHGNSTVKAYNDTTVKAYARSTVTQYGGKVELSGLAACVDRRDDHDVILTSGKEV